MQSLHLSPRNLGVFMLLMLGSALSAGCGTAPPVQEMSNARQAVQAAREAGAEQFAAYNLTQAEQLFRRAAVGLEQGDYRGARQDALAARHAAAKARVAALDAVTDEESAWRSGF
jgi:hypothetical protein